MNSDQSQNSQKHPTNARDNRLLNTLEMRARKVKLVSRPYSVQLEATSRCNLSCVMCSRDRYHGVGEDALPEVVETVKRDLLPLCHSFTPSWLGEPMMYPRFREILEQIRPGSGTEVGFFSNFLLLTEDLAETIVRSGVSYINVSIDGATKETYEKIRRGAKWETLIEKLELFQRVKKRLGGDHPRLELYIVGSVMNVDEIPLFVDFAKRYGFDRVNYYPNMYTDDASMNWMSLVHEKEKTIRMFRRGLERSIELDMASNFHEIPFGGKIARGPSSPAVSDPTSRPSFPERIFNRIKQLYTVTVLWRYHQNRLQSGGTWKNFWILFYYKLIHWVWIHVPILGKKRRRILLPYSIPNHAPPAICGNPWTHVQIKTSGLVYPCCFSSDVMGDLRKQSFEEIWNGAKYQDLRRSLNTGKYWSTCRSASCNWVAGHHSTHYGSVITLMTPLEELDGSRGGTIRVRLENTGKMIWSKEEGEKRGRVTLSYRIFVGNHRLIDEGVHHELPRSVGKGEGIEMELEISPVRHSGEAILWVDLVHEGVTWFGERGNNALEAPVRIVNVPFGADVTVWNPSRMRQLLAHPLRAGDRLKLPLRIKNVATQTLGREQGKDYLSYHWGRMDGEWVKWDGVRTEINPPIESGQWLDLEASLEVPGDLTPGIYRLEFDVVRENEAWLSLLWNRPVLGYLVRVGEGVDDGTGEKTGTVKLNKGTGEREKNGEETMGVGERGQGESEGGLDPSLLFESYGQCAPRSSLKGIWRK